MNDTRRDMGAYARAVLLILGIFVFVLFIVERLLRTGASANMGHNGDSTIVGWILQLIPFVLMGLLLIFILTKGRNYQYRWYGPGPQANVGIADQLQKLSELRKEGALTEDEFEAAKKRIIQS